MTDFKLISIDLDDRGLPTPTPEIESERKVAIYDLIEENSFAPVPPSGHEAIGPFALKLGINEGRLVFDVTDKSNDGKAQFILSLSPFRQTIKDYFDICHAYFEAVKNLPPSQIEAIDMGRRGIHNEGARLLAERLEGKIDIDHDTARRLFTLISALHFRG